MPIFPLPKTIRWIGLCGLLLLLLMSLYRLGIYIGFYRGISEANIAAADWWLGFRFDARLVATVSLAMLLLSFLPGMHFFKHRKGKKTAQFFYAVFAAALLLFYAADLVSLLSGRTRLNAAFISEIFSMVPGKLHWSKGPWVTMLVITGVMVWLFIIITGRLHAVISHSPGKGDKKTRVYWQALLFVVCVLLMYGRVGLSPLSAAGILKAENSPATQLALTPPESFWATQSDKHP